MASIVAYIEVREGAITSPSLFAVTESRRIAEAAGATVYACLPVGAIPHTAIDGLAEKLSAAGADRILCSAAPELAGPALDVTHGPLLVQLADQLRPLLVLFPAGGCGSQLGPPLAIRIGAAYVPGARLDVHTVEGAAGTAPRRVLVTRWRAAQDGMRRLDVGDLERPVVAVLLAGRPGEFLGQCQAEVEMFPCPTGNVALTLLRSMPDPDARLELCTTLVWCPRASAAELPALAAELPSDECAVIEGDPGLTRTTPERVLMLAPEGSPLPAHNRATATVALSPGALATALRRTHDNDPESRP